MIEKKIYTSLYVYSNYLFSAHMNGIIEIQKLPKDIFHYFPISKLKTLPIDTASWIIDMQAYKNVLFASTTKAIFSYKLKAKEELRNSYSLIKFVPNCTHLRIDYKNKYLFAISENRGIIAVDIKNPNEPRKLSEFRPFYLKKRDGYFPVSDFDVYNGMIFIALRSYGIVRIDYERKFSAPKVFREFLKIPLNDPQDVKYSPHNKYLYVIDSQRGLVVTDLARNRIIFDGIIGNNEDFPQKIIIHYNNAIIKCKNSIYYFKSSQNKISKIYDKKVGAITKYYGRIIFSRKGKLNLIKIGVFKDNEKTNLKKSKIKFKSITNING